MILFSNLIFCHLFCSSCSNKLKLTHTNLYIINQKANKQITQTQTQHQDTNLFFTNYQNPTMSQTQNPTNPKHLKSIRKIAFIFGEKVTERQQHFFYRLKLLSIQKSEVYLSLRIGEIAKRLTHVYGLKLREYFSAMVSNVTALALQVRHKGIELNRVKDRVYEAKVKSLRVLSRQWKEKRSQNQYKEKYFQPKSEQTPKMLKEKTAQEFYLLLRSMLRNKYLQAFSCLKHSEALKGRNSRALYLANYLLFKRRYWLTFGLQKLKLNILMNRQERNKEEIGQLDTRLVPVQDSEITALKQKQDKLLAGLQAIAKEKEAVTVEVETEVEEIQQGLEKRRTEIKQMKERRELLGQGLVECRERLAGLEFDKQEMFYTIYVNFLTNLKLWAEMQTSDDLSSILIGKQTILQWLQTPSLDLNLDRIHLSPQQLSLTTQTLCSLIQQYQRLRQQPDQLQLPQIYRQFFTKNGTAQCPQTYEQLHNRIRFAHKFMIQILKENNEVLRTMLANVEKGYEKVQGEGVMIREE